MAMAAAVSVLGEGVELVPDRGVAVLQRDAALGRLVETGDAIEHRGLAGAVWSDQRGDLATLGDERQVIDGDETAEAHGEMLDVQHGISHPRPSRTSSTDTALRSLRNTEGCRVETRPRGFRSEERRVGKECRSRQWWFT